jgi:glycosyltransferase involved in cell wall biosynthesis
MTKRGQRLRILIISSCPEVWGGSEELWWSGAMTLLERGHRVDVVRPVVVQSHPRIVALASRGGRTTALSTGGERPLLALSALTPRRWRINERRQAGLAAAFEIARRRPHLVVVSQGQNYDGLLFAQMAQRLRVPYVVISQKASERYWPPDTGRDRLHRAHAGARASLFVSEHNRRVTEDQIGPIDCAQVVRNPVLFGHEGPLAWPSVEPLRLACVARLHAPEKGQDALLRVLAQQRWRERKFQLTFYGSGYNAIGLQDLASRLELDQVHFAGSTDDVPAVWESHSALVLPSRMEGLPLALVEAMMCGRPGIVTPVGGNAEIVEDGVTGFVSAGSEVEALGDALERAWTHREQWEAMGIRAASEIRRLVPDGPHDAGIRLADLVEAEA